jgi:hypothetical protein
VATRRGRLLHGLLGGLRLRLSQLNRIVVGVTDESGLRFGSRFALDTATDGANGVHCRRDVRNAETEVKTCTSRRASPQLISVVRLSFEHGASDTPKLCGRWRVFPCRAQRAPIETSPVLEQAPSRRARARSLGKTAGAQPKASTCELGQPQRQRHLVVVAGQLGADVRSSRRAP